MNNFHSYITPEEYIAKCKESGTEHLPLKKLKRQAKASGMCDICGAEEIWKLAGTGMCFSCTTGEADASCDYELRGE